MANNAAMAGAEQAQLNVEQSKLPLFHGDKKQDQFAVAKFDKERCQTNLVTIESCQPDQLSAKCLIDGKEPAAESGK